MPNHCENDLYFAGPEKEVQRFMAFVGADKDTPEFDCNAVIPYPEKFKQMDEEAKAFAFFGQMPNLTDDEREAAKKAYEAKWGTTQDGFNSGGYKWCCEDWGTKWGAYDVSMYMNPRRGMCLSFQSAWSPPLPVIRKLFALFPAMQFEFEYFERGGGFCGGLYYNPEELEYGGDAESEWYSDTYCGPRGG